MNKRIEELRAELRKEYDIKFEAAADKSLTLLRRCTEAYEALKLHEELGGKPMDFKKTYGDRLGVPVASVAKLLRYGAIPEEVQTIIRGTPVENTGRSLDKLVLEALSLEQKKEIATKLVAGDVEEEQQEAEPSNYANLMVFEGVRIDVSPPDGPEITDVELAKVLGYGRTRRLRELIVRHAEHLSERARAPHGAAGGAFVLCEEDALYLTAKSETPKANALTRRMVKVFVEARKYLSAGSSAMTAEISALKAEVKELRQLLTGLAANSVLGHLPISDQVVTVVPHKRPEERGHSTRSLVRRLRDEGFELCETDAKAIAVCLKMVGDNAQGFYSAEVGQSHGHHTDNWRWRDAAANLLYDHFKQFCLLKEKYKKDGKRQFRAEALRDYSAGLVPVGTGTKTTLSSHGDRSFSGQPSTKWPRPRQ